MANQTPSPALIPPSVSIPISMFAFFLIFATVGGIVELTSEGNDGEQSYALFAAAASTIVFGLAMSWIGTRLPARWWGEAVLVAVIFYGIWLIMFAISSGINGEAVLSGLLYAVISGIIGALFFQVLGRQGGASNT